MRSPQLLALVLVPALLAAHSPGVAAQTLLGVDGIGVTAWEFSASAAGACPAPLPTLASCPYTASPACGIPPPGPIPPGSLLGDIADDPLSDTFFLTDGFLIEQYTLDTPCVGPMTCGPVQSFPAPSSLGPITGMGFDHTGGVVTPAGSPALWITDGRLLMAIAPSTAAGCTYTIVYGPCFPVLPPNNLMTDVTWDPNTGHIWACDSTGLIHEIDVFTCTLISSFSAVGCGLGTPLTGIAYDGGTPPTPPLTVAPPALYVTDGLVVARMTTSGGPASPTFASPSACTPTPAFLSGLALTQHGVTYGTNRVIARLRPYGQSTTPSSNFGVEVLNAPAGANAWFVLGFNFPGLGHFCPSVTGASTKIWVDPTFPGSVSNIGPLPGGCFALPLPIPAGAPLGLEAFVQIVYIAPGGPPAVDATNAIAATVMLP